MKTGRLRLPRSNVARIVLSAIFFAGVIALLWWRGPSWNGIGDAFRSVRWEWVAVAIALNLLSVVSRALAWRAVIDQAMEPPHPSFPLVFSAFSVGLFA